MYFPPLSKQIYASCGMLCLLFSHGYMMGIQSILLPYLKRPESEIKLTLDQESWIPSITVLMVFPAQVISGLLTDKYGRKYVFSYSLLPNLIAFIMIYYAKDFYTLFAASLIAGFFGGGMAIGHFMIAEICSPKNRATMLNFKQAFCALGAGFPHLLGHYYDYKTLVLFGVIPCVLGFISVLTSPESPAWLAGQGRFEECKDAFFWLRGHNEDAELKELIESQKRNVTKKKSDEFVREKGFKVFFNVFFNKTFLKALSISFSGLILVDVTGKGIFSVYAIDLINSVSKDSVNPYFYALGLDLADILAAFISCIVVRKLKRRTLLFGSSGIALAFLLLFCIVAFLRAKLVIPADYSWVALLIIAVYFVIVSVGIIPMVFTILAEVYPLEFRGLGVAASSFVFATMMFMSMKITPSLIRSFGVHGTFLINSILMAISIMYLYYVIPETNNRTLQDIENEMKGERHGNDLTENKDFKEKMLTDIEK